MKNIHYVFSILLLGFNLLLTTNFIQPASAETSDGRTTQINILVTDEETIPNSWNAPTDFDGGRAKNHVEILASDSLGGRYSGFIGTDKSDRYISDHFKKLGLIRPFGENGYRQEFTYGAGEYKMPCNMCIIYNEARKDTITIWQDYNNYKYSGFGKVKGRIVFAGYGISEPDLGWDEYEGIDVTGAIVMVLRGTPAIPNLEWNRQSASGYKSTTALAKGAVGFIMANGELPKLATISEKYYREEMPAVWIREGVADSILSSTGKTLAEWKKKIDSGFKPVSQVLDVEADFQVSGAYYPERETCNLAGIIPGSDPDLADELIIIGAHMDHHGVDAAGNIFPGADDNASGTSAVMELARIFSKASQAPKRSVMFAGFAAEEEGLVGARRFVEYLPVPGYDVVAMINMDMVGQGNGDVGIGGINEFPILGEIMFSQWPDSSLESLDFWGLHGGSDHAAFRDAGIPAYVVGARGGHPNYHTPNDTSGAIKPDVLKAVGDMVYHVAENLGNHPEPLSPQVNQAAWINWRTGGIKFASLQSPYLPINQKIKVVDYPQPLLFVSIDPPNKISKTKSDHIFSSLEQVRMFAADNAMPFLADSLLRDFKGESFRGVTTIVSGANLPDDPSAYKAMSREGLAFTDVTGLAGDKYPLSKRTISKLEKLALKCKHVGIRPLLYNSPVEVALAVLEIFDGQLICRYDVDRVNGDRSEDLIEAGAFIILEADQLTNPFVLTLVSASIESIKDSELFNSVGIIASRSLVESLLETELERGQIEDLLMNNLCVQMRDWWGNN
ncbi:MAG: M28 family peptidase [Calditrichaeota bacterium]|nr:M28 family peptidase [Calditrichota bacterium]